MRETPPHSRLLQSRKGKESGCYKVKKEPFEKDFISMHNA